MKTKSLSLVCLILIILLHAANNGHCLTSDFYEHHDYLSQVHDALEENRFYTSETLSSLLKAHDTGLDLSLQHCKIRILLGEKYPDRPPKNFKEAYLMMSGMFITQSLMLYSSIDKGNVKINSKEYHTEAARIDETYTKLLSFWQNLNKESPTK